MRIRAPESPTNFQPDRLNFRFFGNIFYAHRTSARDWRGIDGPEADLRGGRGGRFLSASEASQSTYDHVTIIKIIPNTSTKFRPIRTKNKNWLASLAPQKCGRIGKAEIFSASELFCQDFKAISVIFISFSFSVFLSPV